MPTANPTHLLKLADREFRQLTEERLRTPSDRKFQPMKLNASKFDSSWDRVSLKSPSGPKPILA
jgi:hypothetical protein